jgi:hypothetical protein
MIIGKFLAAVLGLLYLYFVVETFSGHVRNGWVFRSVTSKKRGLYFFLVGQDFAVALIFLWIAFFQTSYLYGRTTMLRLAHLAMTSVFLGDFQSTDDEGNPQNWGCFAKPLFFILSIYWYYLVLVSGVSLVDIFDAIEAFLDA